MKPHLALTLTLILAAFVLAGHVAVGLRAEPIHPLIVGNNLWWASSNNPAASPSAEVMGIAEEAGIRVIRIGGAAFNGNMPSDSALRTWVGRIRAIGAEPLVQMASDRTGAQAAAIVRALNGDPATRVTYWSIGNEPFLEARRHDPGVTQAEIAPVVEEYFKRIAGAMKAEDDSIKIFGIDSEDLQSDLHGRLFGGANNIAGKVPGHDYYYCDGLAWHRYPQQPGVDPAREGLNDIRTRIINARNLVDRVNQSQSRTGSDALVWAVTEVNSRNGETAHTFGNGQMFAGVFGLSMKYGATFVTPWSLQESAEHPRGPTDFGLVEAPNMTRRPSFWHTQFVADHFRGIYLEGNPSIADTTSDLLVYGADDFERDRISVMILNRGTTARPFTLHLNSGASFGSGNVLNVDADRSDTHTDTLPARATLVLVFARDSLTRIAYGSADFDQLAEPQTTVLPRSSGSLLDDFSYPTVDDQAYWSPLTVGDGDISVAGSDLVLRASNSAYASAAVASPVAPSFNFFERTFTVGLTGFAQSTAEIGTDATHFRLSLNSSQDRSYRADDSLALRITPNAVRLGFKIDQPDVQGELRTGSSSALGSLEEFSYDGTLHAIRLSVAPEAGEPVEGVSEIRYVLQLEGSFGHTIRRGTFAAPATDWGDGGDTSLVIESRRESSVVGGSGSFVETRIDKVFRHPGTIDSFDTYADFSEQGYWQTHFVGDASTAEISGGSAVLTARASPFASSALAGPVTPDLNFHRQAFTLHVSDLALTANRLIPDQTYFRLSLNSSSERAFRAADALTLRVTPEQVRLGYKLDQPDTDAENRSGEEADEASLLDFDPAGAVTAIDLTLAPIGIENSGGRVFYALRLSGSFGTHFRSGTLATAGLWGTPENPAGESALVFEARRASSTTDSSSSVAARIGEVRYVPIPNDFFAEAPHFASWRLRNFGAAELADPGQSGAAATPAGDGVAHLLKYAFDLDPKQAADFAQLPSAQMDGAGRFVITHNERPGASDIRYEVEASTDLVDWSLPVVEANRSASSAAGWSQITTRADTAAEVDRIFLRVRVSP